MKIRGESKQPHLFLGGQADFFRIVFLEINFPAFVPQYRFNLYHTLRQEINVLNNYNNVKKTIVSKQCQFIFSSHIDVIEWHEFLTPQLKLSQLFKAKPQGDVSYLFNVKEVKNIQCVARHAKILSKKELKN